MGISGLLPFLEESSRPVHISEFKNLTVAIDSYCWLHKGAFGCCEKLARGEDTNGYVLYCLKYIKLLQHYNIRPIMVFDGRHLPAKEMTEKKRREQRQFAKKRAAELLRLDRANEARNYLRQCVDITHEMALALIKECRNMGVDCIVAPYEADSQLAYLNIKKIADVVITEDSDLTLFGCNKILFKFDLSGNGVLVDSEKLYISMKMRPDAYTFDKFRYMCILSGCDYLQSLPGVGLKKAQKFIKLTADPDIHNVLTKIPSYLNMKQLVVTDEYREQFMIADATFRHQIVFDPLKRKLVRLNEPEDCGTNLEYCRNAGEYFDNETAFQLALGNLDPFTLKQMDDWNPDTENLSVRSIWSREFSKSKPCVFESKVKIKHTVMKSVTVEVNTEIIEKEKEEFDKSLSEQLKMYTLTDNSPKEEEKAIEKPEIAEEKTSPETSPILNKSSSNPFLKLTLKKSNKIPKTTVDQNCIVRSRFFHKLTQIQETATTNLRTAEESPENEPNPKRTKPHETPQKMPLSPKKDNTEISESQELNTRKKSYDLDEDFENLTPPCSSSSTSTVIEIDDEETSCEKTIVKTTLSVKKSFRGTCRPVGLQRKNKKAVPKNQQTLLSMFSSMQQ